jgi:DNA-directed RNA polymerase beta' subunit
MLRHNYTPDVKTIQNITFTILSNNDTKQYSAIANEPIGIKNTESYNGYTSVQLGPADIRGGTSDPYIPCLTCGLNYIDCPGHFMHVALPIPVYHIGFLEHVCNILKCICLKCSKILVSEQELKNKKILNKKQEYRFREIKVLSKNITSCSYCGTHVPKIKKEIKEKGTINILIEMNNTNEDTDNQNKIIKEYLLPKNCSNIFRNISDEHCAYLGFNIKFQRPEDYIIENFPIAPITIRPTARLDFMSASTMEHGLTLKIVDIITKANQIRQQMEKNASSIDTPYTSDLKTLLQYHVATYFDNKTATLPKTEFKTGNRVIKSISDGIKGKTGRVRSNLMGKRVEFSARTVITPDPYININQLGIPKRIATELTIPEEVTPQNINYLSGLVKNGRDIYPGANFVLRNINQNGKNNIQKIDLKYRKSSIKLNIGDIVERHCIDGDYVLFNRQPTLHKPSMMGHSIKVLDNDNLNTFRMNISVCGPYGADFDGDEMNIFLPQSIQARNEIKRLADVKYQIIGVKESKPIIGCTQDTLSGAFVLSNSENILYGREICNLLCNTSIINKNTIKIDMNKKYNGKDIFSYIIPDGVNIIKKSDNNISFQIENGKFIKGNLDKSSLSLSKNSIIHIIWDKYGPDRTSKFIDDAQKLVLNYTLTYGTTIGFKDVVTSKTFNEQIAQIINNKILESKYNITQYENDTIQLPLDMIELLLSKELNALSSTIEQSLSKELKSDNFLNIAAKSGAKGNISSIKQMIACIGQTSVEGVRIKKKIENRALIYFHSDDDTPEARGFIKSSFLSGLKGFEFFYNAMAAREGLMDTALKSVTWETEIIIIENNQAKYIEIGKWIDNLLENNKDNVKHYTERQMELLDIKDKIYIPTTDYNGNVTWGEISAITRHDPGEQLYEIKTDSGRSVIVTESKSLLIWNNETKQFKELLTPDIKIGDYVPVTENLCTPPIINTYIDNKINTHIDKFELNEDNGIFIGLFLSSGNINDSTISIKYKNENIKTFIENWFNKNSINWSYDSIKNNTINGYSNTLSTFLNKFNKYVPVEAYNAPEEFIIGILNGYFSGDGYISKNSINARTKSKKLIQGLSMLCSRINVFCKLSNTNIRISAQWAQQFSNKITLLDDNKNTKMKNKKWILSHLKYKTINNVILDKIVDITLVDVKNHPKVYDLTIPSTFNFGLANGLQVRDTAQTGYIQRQLIKGLEDLSIKYDGTNRNAKGTIIQLVYGENGINQAAQSEIKFNIIKMNNKQVDEQLCLSSEEIKLLKHFKNVKDNNNKYYEKLINFRDELRRIQSHALINFKTLEELYVLPINLIRITQDYTNNKNKKDKYDLDPKEIEEHIELFLTDYENRIIACMKKTDKFMIENDRKFKFLLEVGLNEYLCPKKCIFEYKLNKDTFLKMMDEIKLSYYKSIIDPGEMVGIISAQSIGEPTSQMSVIANTKLKVIIKNKKTNKLTIYGNNIGPFCDKIINDNPILTNTIQKNLLNSVETNLESLDNEYYIVGVDSKEQTHWNKISHVSRHPVNGNLITIRTKSGRTVTTTLSHSHLIRRNQSVEPILGSELKLGMRVPVAKHIDNTFINDTIKIGDVNFKLDYNLGCLFGSYLAKGLIRNNSIYINNCLEEYVDIIKKTIEILNEKLFLKIKLSVNKLLLSEICIIYDEMVKFITNNFQDKSVNKIPDFIFTSPDEFKTGFLQSYINNNSKKYNANENIIIYNYNEKLNNDIGLLLNYCDIFSCVDEVNSSLIISSKYRSLKHVSEDIDKINGLEDIINSCCEKINYHDVIIDNDISREKLNTFINIFEGNDNISNELEILKQAYNSSVIWDEIINIDIYTPNQTDYVYDFTVPGNETFMVNNGIIIHNTLDTKHSAGQAGKGSANMGVNRIQELVHNSKNIKTPQMQIYFNSENENNQSNVKVISSYLPHLVIRDLLSNVQVYYLINNNEIATLIKNDNTNVPFFINNQTTDVNTLPFIFRIELDFEKMLDKEITLLDIKTKFISHWQKYFTNLKNLKKHEKEIISVISRCAILSNSITSKSQVIHIRFSMNSFNNIMIIDFLNMILDDITLKGVENITNINIESELKIKYNDKTGDIIEDDKEYVVYTSGINFEEIKYIKGLDMTRTKCNNINTILKMYGIEATRQILIHELYYTYENAGNRINLNHLSLLVDQMCHTGLITSIDRNGMGKLDIDPIARASFEKTMDHFIHAALFNESDTMKSISSRIAIGQVINGGTGAFDLLLDTKKLENSEYIEDELSGRISFLSLEEEPILNDIMKYTSEKNDFFNPLL